MIIAAVFVLAGCAAGGSSGENAAVAERTVAKEAWDELSSILTDVGLTNAEFNQSLKWADPTLGVMMRDLVPYDEYVEVRKRLRAWLGKKRFEYAAYWDELAESALTTADALVGYAQGGGDYLLDQADAGQARSAQHSRSIASRRASQLS
jgi:hypothetical protein